MIGLPSTAVHPILGIIYANYAATNQKHVFSCIVIDVIIMLSIGPQPNNYFYFIL